MKAFGLNIFIHNTEKRIAQFADSQFVFTDAPFSASVESWWIATAPLLSSSPVSFQMRK